MALHTRSYFEGIRVNRVITQKHAVLFQSLLIQDDHIPAGNAQYASFLHRKNDSGTEPLRRHGCLNDMRMLPSRPCQEPALLQWGQT